MGWWKADPPAQKADSIPPPTYPTSQLPPSHPPVASSSEIDSCPVDHKTREIWLQQAKAQRLQQQQQQQQATTPPPLPPAAPSATPPSPTFASTTSAQSQECSSDWISQAPDTVTITIPSGRSTRTLSQAREVSTIPRAQPTHPSTSTAPSNSEQETGQSASGNWIYPSETQFFNAVMRKSSTSTSAHDLASSISSIIPIHNAVNERAWHLIKQWEGDSSKVCGGPKLLGFQGLGAGALSPKAKWNTTVMGASEPFDRHDWTVERCNGQTVDYIIDFYQGKEREDVDPRRRAQELNFYLDVRPKLNSVEGWRMRAERAMGWR